MKNLVFTQLLLFFACLSTFGQTYSSIVSDKEITSFIDSQAKGEYTKKINKWKLEEVYQPDSVLKKVGPWNTWTFSQKRINTFSYGAAPLLADYLTKEDFAFIKEQISAIKTLEWENQKEPRRKIGAKHKENEYYVYSIPVFSKDKKYALIKTDFNCGNLCGWSCIELFKQDAKGFWENNGCFSKKLF